MLLFALVLAAEALPSSQRQEMEPHPDGFAAHMARVHAKGWRLQPARPEKSALLRLVIAVKQSGVNELETTATEVSDPRSAGYGKYLTNDAVHATVAPSRAASKAVRIWLEAHGVRGEQLTPNGDFVAATVNVSVAEALLATTYGIYTHTTGATATRVTSEYSLPSEVSGHVDFVSPTVSFFRPSAPSTNRPVAARDERPELVRVTPAELRALYSMNDSDVGKGGTANNSQAVASFIGQYYSAADLRAFWAKYPLPGGVSTPFADVPTTQPHSPVGTEAALDTQFISALGAGIPTQSWYTAGDQPGNPGSEPFVAWLTRLAGTSHAPDLFSISYGDEENGVTPSYAQRTNVEFMKAAARGVSLLAAAGDSGAGCSTTGYVPTFPASSPWITAVGGLEGPVTRGAASEVVWPSGGGGFSNYFARPAYQEAAAAAYLGTAGLPAQHLWNRTGSAFPDVAAHAKDFDVCTDGFFYPVAGTSAASPTVAGLFATLNQVRADHGRPKLGFLNPLIYQHAAAFNDITSGTIDYCDEPEAFPAAPGWDAASGMGSPNFAKLKEVVLNL